MDQQLPWPLQRLILRKQHLVPFNSLNHVWVQSLCHKCPWWTPKQLANGCSPKRKKHLRSNVKHFLHISTEGNCGSAWWLANTCGEDVTRAHPEGVHGTENNFYSTSIFGPVPRSFHFLRDGHRQKVGEWKTEIPGLVNKQFAIENGHL